MQHGRFQYREAGRASFDRCLDTGQELIGRSHLTNFETLAAGLSGGPQLRQRHGSERITRGHDHRDNANAGADLFQDLQPLAADFGSLGSETGNICARPVQALDDASSDGSPTLVKTMGIVLVAACAALTVSVPKPVTITSGFVETDSAAS